MTRAFMVQLGTAAILCLVGFATFLFNFVGVNLFVGGLHSYAK